MQLALVDLFHPTAKNCKLQKVVKKLRSKFFLIFSLLNFSTLFNKKFYIPQIIIYFLNLNQYLILQVLYIIWLFKKIKNTKKHKRLLKIRNNYNDLQSFAVGWKRPSGCFSNNSKSMQKSIYLRSLKFYIQNYTDIFISLKNK